MKTNSFKNTFATMFPMLTLGFYAKSQNPIWTNHYTNNSAADDERAITIGGDGRIYVCGSRVGDALTISYTTGGATNTGWPQFYNGSGNSGDHGDAVVTYGTGSSIKIYVAGSSNVSGNGQDMLVLGYN